MSFSDPHAIAGSKEIPSLGRDLIRLLSEIGAHLGFEVALEVEASEAAWVDVVWFDARLGPSAFGGQRPRIRHQPLLPIAGFEVEVKTGLSAKHVKGSVSNLNNLGALLGCVVIGSGNLSSLQKRSTHAGKSQKELEKTLVDRVYRWVYAESQPRGRIVVMSEGAVCAWAKALGLPDN